MEGKKIYVWVGSSSPFNSLNIQAQLHVDLIFRLYQIKPILIHPDIKGVREIIKSAIKNRDILFWHFGSFDYYLLGLNKANIIFVYHNITPEKFFWKYDFLVSIKSLIGQLQLKLINKKNQWITMSKFNQNELNSLGFRNVLIIPNVVNVEKGNFTKTENVSLLFVGRISPNKNCVQLLLEIEKVVSILKKTIEVHIIGSGKIKCGFNKAFEETYSRLLNNPFLVLKWDSKLNETDLKKRYGESWLYVSMSKHEGFGVPVCESILHGTPAVYLESGGQESVLNNLGMVSLKDEFNFHKKIIELIEDDNMRSELLEGQLKIVKHYSFPNVLISSVSVFNKVLKRKAIV